MARAHKWALDAVTPGTVMGPFYPVANKPPQAGADLTRFPGRSGTARGRVLYVTGRVLNMEGEPVVGARVEIWQANAEGRYSHPSDGNRAPVDRNFAGYGAMRSASDGRFRFRTVLPSGYPVIPGWDRAPHIHFLVTGRTDRHVTQMWFPGHPLNAQDRLLLNVPAGERTRLIASMEERSRRGEPGSLLARFDIVLPNG